MGNFSDFAGCEEQRTHELLALEFFDAFASTLTSAYSVDLSTHTYIAYSNDPKLRKFWQHDKWELIHTYITTSVHRKDQEALSLAVDVDYMRTSLAQVPSYSVDLRDFAGGTMRYLRCTIMRGRDANHAAVSFTDITAERAFQDKRLAEEHELHALLDEFQIAQGYGTFRAQYDEAHNYVHIIWSEQAYKILGLSTAVSVSHDTWLNRVHPDDKDKADISNLKLHLKGTTNDAYDTTYRFLVGSTYRYIREVGRFLRRKDGTIHTNIGYFMDVTDEVTVREQQSQLQAVCDMMQAGSWRLTLDLEGQITGVKWSDDFRRHLGYTNKEDFPDDFEAWAQFVHPEDFPKIMHDFYAAAQDLTGQSAFSFDYRARKASGEYNWYRCSCSFQRDAKGHAISGFGILLDVNDSYLKAEQEQKLRKAYANLAKQMKIIGGLSTEYTSVWLLTADDMSINPWRDKGKISIRKAVEQISEHGNYEATCAYYASHFVHPDDRKLFLEQTDFAAVQAALDKQSIYKVNYRRRLESTYRHTQILHFRPNLTDNSQDFVIAYKDVEEEYQAEVLRRKALEDAFLAAEHANKAKTTFLNSMSHDIRTPMNAIVGFTALASAHLTNAELVRDYLNKIAVSSKHLLSLINDVLDMSRIESGNVKIDAKEVHLPDVFHDLRSIIQGDVAAKQLDLLIDTVDVVNEDIICDRLRLNQVLLNLVSNAVKFTPTGGTISIRVRQKPCDRANWANYSFTVKDTGIGISEEFQKHIFEAFTREQTSTVTGIQGTGLGLAITKNIVDMMNGTISVISELGKGSEFTVDVCLPTVDTGAIETPPAQLKDLSVLVADDDLNTCLSVAKMLHLIGMRCEWTTSGKEAVVRTSFALEQQEEFYAYIIDWLMPDMNGIETVRRIRQIIGASHPIIILTAYDWSDIEEEARAAGVTDFCAKPLFLSDLKEIFYRPFCVRQEIPTPLEEKLDFSGKKILLVEDNILNMELATTILTESGFVVTSAYDGDEAVEILRRAPEGEFDAVLMDIQMPRMDGYTATREIRTLPHHHNANVPIIAMTANAFEEDRTKAFQAGMNDFITKPVDIDNLLATLGKVLH